jgi:hypothetical protein
MVTIHHLDPVKAIPILMCQPTADGPLPARWPAFCKEHGLLALAAEQDGAVVGFAVAESNPQVLHVLGLEGDTHVCRRLLGQLLRLASERDVTGWFPIERTDLRKMLRRWGFRRRRRAQLQGRRLCLYHWERNAY